MNTKLRGIFCFVLLLAAALPPERSAGAEAATPPMPTRPADILPPSLRVPLLRAAEEPVRLRSLDLKITVQGGMAETGLDMVFYNPNGRALEGELQFPLLPGQEISGLALDIGGEMREGVPVPKARGQEVFEEIVRGGADPALLEAEQGNAFALRVYPLPARGTRRVIVRVMQPLEERNGEFSLRLPLDFAGHLDSFGAEILVASAARPRVEGNSLGLVLERAGTLYRGSVRKTDIAPEGWLDVGVPAAGDGAPAHAVRHGDGVYFTAAVPVPLRREKREPPKRVTIVWDASASGAERDHAAEYALLDKYFAAMEDGAARLLVLRDRAEAEEEFAVRGGDWSELKTRLHALAYDGGTNLDAWTPADDCREYLLFTDGIETVGDDLERKALPALGEEQRLYAVASSVAADRTFLRHASEGRLLDLLGGEVDAAAAALLTESTRVRIAPEDLAGLGEALLEPAASAAPAVSIDGAEFLLCRVAGRLAPWNGGGKEKILLRVTHPDGKEETAAVTLPPAEEPAEETAAHGAEGAPLAARLWGRCKIAELEADAFRNKAAIERIGIELGIVSSGASLIVLESAADYLRYGIPLPDSLKKKAEGARVSPSGGAEYLPDETLLRMWNDKVARWENPPAPAVKKTGGGMPAPNEPRRAAPIARRQSGQAGLPATAASSAPAMEAAPPAFAPVPQAEIFLDAVVSSEDFAEAAAASESAGIPSAAGARIALQAWTPDAPCIARMDRAASEEMYAVYLDKRPGFARSAAFFLDMAGRFFAAGMRDLGLRVLSNIAELEPENRQVLRIFAYRLLEAGEAAAARGVLEKVRLLAPYEPQSLRDLALAEKALGNGARAVELLYEVARRRWDPRFGDINTIALTELNAIVATENLDARNIDSRFVRNLASDLRVTLSWDMDSTDMDLWVTDPSGELCKYDNPRTRAGGTLSADCTQGYGPEEFLLRNAEPGLYRVELDYYGSSRQTLFGEVTCSASLTTGFGTPEQKEEIITLRLKREKERVFVGEFTVDASTMKRGKK